MPASFNLYIHPKVVVPTQSRLRLVSSFFDYTFKLDSAGSFLDWVNPVSTPQGLFKFLMEFAIGQEKPVQLEAANMVGDIGVILIALPATAIPYRTHGTYFVGNIVHGQQAVGQPGCVVTCLNDGERSGDGNCCVECENADAIVKICC